MLIIQETFIASYIRFADYSKKLRRIAVHHHALALLRGTFQLQICDLTVRKALRKTT